MKFKNLKNQFKNALIFSFLLVGTLIFQGCNNDNDTILNSENISEKNDELDQKKEVEATDYNGYKIYNNVKVIDTNENLVTLGESEVIFKASAQINTINKGDVIVGDIMENAPYGFIRKVVAITKNNNEVILTTVLGSLDEVVAEGDINIEKQGYELFYEGSDFDFQGMEKINGFDNAHLNRGNVTKSFNFGKSKDVNGIKFELKGTGTVKFSFNWTKRWFYTKSLETYTQLNLNTKLIGGVKYNFNKTVSLVKLNLPTLRFTVGPIPIVLKNTFYVDLNAKSLNRGAIEAGMEINGVLKAGTKYRRGNGWSPIKYSSFDAKPLIFFGDGSAKASFSAPIIGVKTNFYGYQGASIYSDFSQIYNVSIKKSWWSSRKAYFDGSTRFAAGVKLNMLGFKADYSYKKDFNEWTEAIRF